ncbi:MAG: hypothetical protein LBU78_09325 [Microbacterium sp.]|nr:hypothetical protein [Microbacterium sp.]
MEIGADVVTVAATDRSVLLARTGIPAIVDGPPARARILPQPAIEWLPSQGEVHLSIERATGGGTARVLLSGSDGDVRAVEGLSDLFPGVAEVIGADSAAGGRAVFDTTAVRDLLEPARPDDVALVIEDSSASLRYDGRSVRGRAIGCTTTARSLSCRSLRLISEAVVGPELLCDLRDDGRSLLWRDAAQPDFAGLMLSQQP